MAVMMAIGDHARIRSSFPSVFPTEGFWVKSDRSRRVIRTTKKLNETNQRRIIDITRSSVAYRKSTVAVARKSSAVFQLGR